MTNTKALGIVSTLFSIAIAGAAIAGQPSRPDAVRMAEAAPNARGCIPGPHEPGRTARIIGQAVSSAWAGAHHPSVDQRPHCRFDSQEEADRDAAR